MKIPTGNIIALFILITLSGCYNSSSKITNKLSLNGEWEIAETSRLDSLPLVFAHKIQVPSLIDMATPKFKKLNYGNDTHRYFWYRKLVTLDHSNIDRVELELNKVKYGAQIYVNNTIVGRHNIAFSSGRFNIKKFLKSGNEANEILIRIGTKENFPDTLICGDDFEKQIYFPGIYDDVNLLFKNTPYIENVQIAPNIENHSIRAQVELKETENLNRVHLRYVVKECNSDKIITKGTHNISIDSSDLTIDFKIEMPGYTLWSPENPFLYELQLSTESDAYRAKFGMRSFSVDTLSKKFLLNNKPYFLRGTNVAIYRFFEDSLRSNLPWDEQWVRKLFAQFKTMNWNSLRFHVGPAPQFWYDIADEMGMLIQDEYSIWYGKKGFEKQYPKITPEQLANEYRNWMRERWNHPCIVVWDAQNETVTALTGKALEMVRDLDISNRPWDNGYSAPTRHTDIIEAHPYLFSKFKRKNVKEPEEGIMKYLFDTIRVPNNDPNQRDPSADGNYYNNASIINEYGWLWLNRNGKTTYLTDEVYNNLFNYAQTSEERFIINARYTAALTEYWRAHKKAAGIQHFCGLTYSKSEEPRGQVSDNFQDPVNLIFNEAFVKYVKPAFSPVGLMVEVWNKSYGVNQNLKAPVYVINDLESEWKGDVILAIYKDDQLIRSYKNVVEAKAFDITITNFEIKLPSEKGRYELRASIGFKDENVRSYRDLNIQ